MSKTTRGLQESFSSCNEAEIVGFEVLITILKNAFYKKKKYSRNHLENFRNDKGPRAT